MEVKRWPELLMYALLIVFMLLLFRATDRCFSVYSRGGGQSPIRINDCTGETWMLQDGQWEPIAESVEVPTVE